MKKLLFLVCILAIVIQSCKTAQISQIPKREIFSGIDFREYTNKGFLFTPEKFEGNYESVGMVSFLIMPEAVKRRAETNPNPGSWQDPGYIYNWEVKKIDIQNAVDGIYKRCVEMGADALVNFKSEINIEDYPYLIPPFKIEGYRISGFAIKRK